EIEGRTGSTRERMDVSADVQRLCIPDAIRGRLAERDRMLDRLRCDLFLTEIEIHAGGARQRRGLRITVASRVRRANGIEERLQRVVRLSERIERLAERPRPDS